LVVKVKLEFKLLSTRKISGGHLLILNVKNRGTSILKNLVVKFHPADPEVPADHAGRFVYALMPSANRKIKFQVPLSYLRRAYFTVNGYSSGDAYFYIKSPVVNVPARKSTENRMLLM